MQNKACLTRLKTTFPRAQAAVELLVVLAIGMVAIGAVIWASQQQLVTAGGTLQVQQARSAVNEIAKAADEVFAEGVGARKQVFVTIPEGTTASSVGNRLINLRLLTPGGPTDVNAKVNEEVYGSIPSKPGGYFIWVSSEENKVRIGAQDFTLEPVFLLVSKTASSETQYFQETIVARNSGNQSINVNLSISWNHTQVTLALANPGDASFNLTPGNSKNVSLNFTVSPAAANAYSGLVSGSASNGETAIVGVIVQVSAAYCPPAVAGNVSYIQIETYKNSSYNVVKKIFDSSENVEIYGLSWPANSTVTLDVRTPANYSVAGYPKNVVTNSTGGFTDSWNPSGYAVGAYTVYANTSSQTKSWPFNLVGC